MYNLKDYYNTRDVADIIGIAQSNFSQGYNTYILSGDESNIYRKIGNLLFIKIDNITICNTSIFTEKMRDCINKNFNILPKWDFKYPMTNFLNELGITFNDLKKLEQDNKIIINNDNGKWSITFINDFINVIDNNYILHVVDKEEFNNLDKDIIISYTELKKNKFLIWY